MALTQRGESLKDVFTRALSHEVGMQSRRQPIGRIRFPLIGGVEGPEVALTNKDIEAALDADDVERHEHSED